MTDQEGGSAEKYAVPPPAYSGPDPSASGSVPPPGAAYYPPAPGQYPPPGQPYPQYPAYPGYPPAPGQPGPPPVAQQPKTTTTTIVINATGNCPSCRIGNLVVSYTMAGICCAIWFFPLGLICCMSWKNRKCTHCGAIYDLD